MLNRIGSGQSNSSRVRRLDADAGWACRVMATGSHRRRIPARAGVASLRLPPDLAPSFDGADLRLDYVIRVLVDRRFMPDTAIERPVAIA